MYSKYIIKGRKLEYFEYRKLMKHIKPSITVGIIAFNEEKGIERILRSVISQSEKKFKITQVIVISDGSTDQTVNHAQRLKDGRLLIISDNARKGKAARINEIFAKADSDIVILLDADIVIPSENTLLYLIEPVMLNSEIILTSGKIVPKKPKNFTQNVVHAGYLLMEEAKRRVKNADAYNCSGAIRAFHKSLYNRIKFPNIAGEDVYPYLYCEKNRYSFQFIPRAYVYYGLPSTFEDYLKQMDRYLMSKAEHQKLFSEEFIKKHFTITRSIKLRSVAKSFLRNPFWISMYLLFLIIPKLRRMFRISKSQGAWESANSSKI